MNRNPAYLLTFIAIIIIAIIGYRYNQYVVQKNFYITVNTQCDPVIENCFEWDCNPEDEPDCDNTPYKKVAILSYEAPKCLEEHTCEVFNCEISMKSCEITYCSDSTSEEWEICSDSTENNDTNEVLEENVIENQ